MVDVFLPERRMDNSLPHCLRGFAVLRLARCTLVAAVAGISAAGVLCQSPAATPPPDKPIRVPASVTNGMLIHKVDPAVPPDAHGPAAVVLRATISKSGDVEDLQLISRPTDAAKAVKDAVMQWKYTRPLLGGVPVEVQTPIVVALGPAGTQLTDQQLIDSGAEEMKAGNFEAAQDLEVALLDRYSYAKDAESLKKLPPNTLGLLRSANLQVQSAASAQQYFEETGIRVKPIGNGVSAPTLTYRVDPIFPRGSKSMDEIVLVNMIVDPKGVPQNVRVLRGVGAAVDEAAVEAVKQYRFKPAMEHGKPVPVLLNVEVNLN